MFSRLRLPLVAAALALVAVVALHPGGVAADPRDFTLVNGSSNVVITHIYVQPSGPGDDWGDDILGADALLPGESIEIVFTRFEPDNCLYDIRVVGKNGEEGEMENIDLCSTLTVTFR